MKTLTIAVLLFGAGAAHATGFATCESGPRESWQAQEKLSATLKEIPPIPFAYFDPGEPPGYRTAWTKALSLRVDVGLAGDVVHPSPAPEPGGGWILPAILGVMAFVLLVLLRRSALPRGRSNPDPASLRMRAAAAAFREVVAAPGADPAAAFARLLGAILDCPPSAVFDPGLAERLREAGVPADLAGRAAAALERLTAARYGGAPAGEDAVEVLRALVEELERPPR